MLNTLKCGALVCVLLLIILQGCATPLLAPPERSAAAKQFKASPEKAIVFVFRDPDSTIAGPFAIHINGILVGAIPRHTFARFELLPGRYRFDFGANTKAPLLVSLEPGENYFLRYEISQQGVWYAANLNPVPDDVGRQAVLKEDLVEHPGVSIAAIRPENGKQGTAANSLTGKLQQPKPASLDDYRDLLGTERK